MTAMTAATIDALSGGRFRLGLGVSGPQVSEGWHGVRFSQPLARTREYVDIVRMAIARKPVAYDGEHYRLPLPDGPGKALRLGFHPPRPAIPIYLAAVGPRNLELAGEIADGWLAIFFAPDAAGGYLEHIERGRSRSGATVPSPAPGPSDGAENPTRTLLTGFDVAPSVPVALGDDIAACADAIRPYAALYIGGMGSRRQNFYNALARRMGFEEAAQRIQDLYLDRRPREAAAAVPVEFIDATGLVGPLDRIRDRLAAFADAGVTTLSISPTAPDLDARVRLLRSLAEALEAAGAAS